MELSAKEKEANPKKIRQKCDKCEKQSAVTLAYGPHYFCENHFTHFFENRLKKTIRKYKLFKPNEKILVALSGGKDSTALLYLLKKFYSKSNSIEALIIDEGVKGYRDKSVKIAIENCKKLEIEYKLIHFREEFGITNDELMPLIEKNPKLGGTCAFCGTMRRNIMNRYAKMLGASKLATGHNLDDEVQSFVMNVFNNDFERMKRMNATSGIIEHEGFVKRIKPLYETPEKEIIAYCAFKEIKHYSEECCPYSHMAKRNEYREMLNHFEGRFPGTKYSILRFNENLRKFIMPEENEKINLEKKLLKCNNCGEPTEKKLCKTCEMVQTLKREAKTKMCEKYENQKEKIKNKKNKKYKNNLTCLSTKMNKK